MYPDFVKQIGSDAAGTRILEICGKQFSAYSYDWYIDDAIDLAAKWKLGEVSYDRIVHLRYWVREIYQHGNDIAYRRLRSVFGCFRFVERVMYAEFSNCEDEMRELYSQYRVDNRAIFNIT